MTTSTIAPPRSRTRTRAGRIALAGLVAAVLTSVVNVAVAALAVALGATQTMQLTPAPDIAFSVIASVVGAVGWSIVDRRATDPRRVLKVLAPTVLVVSFVPDVLLALATASSTGIAPILALALMHVTTISIALAVYARLIPLRPSPTN